MSRFSVSHVKFSKFVAIGASTIETDHALSRRRHELAVRAMMRDVHDIVCLDRTTRPGAADSDRARRPDPLSPGSE